MDATSTSAGMALMNLAGHLCDSSGGDSTVYTPSRNEPFVEQDLRVRGRRGAIGCVDEVPVSLHSTQLQAYKRK